MKADEELLYKLLSLQQTLHFEHPSEAEIDLNTIIMDLTINNEVDNDENRQ